MAYKPTSPHLQIWKWGPNMFTSILHRATGDGLAVFGLALLLWWLGALASGPAAYTKFTDIMGSWFGIAVLVGISWAAFTHMASGVRHLVLDIGAGYELKTNRMWSIASPLIGLALTAAFWAIIYL